MAQQAGAGKPRQEFKGPVKVFILAGQSNMEEHAGVNTLDRLGEHPPHGYLLKRIKQDDGSIVVRDDVFVSYQGSARVYCLGGYRLAEAMKPLLTTTAVTVQHTEG
ncbi:MAG: hypothetical protein NTW21_03805 [Verrucomicrobia bacterium]|nr:hypothetical protein [Verrucomicrobiota bacterium]